MPRVRSLYSRYLSTTGASSLCVLAVFWYRAESEMTSGDARAWFSSSYFASICSKRSNMEFLALSFRVGQTQYCTGRGMRRPVRATCTRKWGKVNSRREPLGNHEFAATLLFQLHRLIQRGDGALDLIVRRLLGRNPLQPQARLCQQGEQ